MRNLEYLREKVDWGLKLKELSNKIFKIFKDSSYINLEDLKDRTLPIKDITDVRIHYFIDFYSKSRLKEFSFDFEDYGSDDLWRGSNYHQFSKIKEGITKTKLNEYKSFSSFLIKINIYNLNKDKYKEVKEESIELRDILESIGYIVSSYENSNFINLSFSQNVDLSELYETPEYLDGIPDNIIVDFEKFLLDKNISTKNSEKLVNIIKRGNW